MVKSLELILMGATFPTCDLSKKLKTNKQMIFLVLCLFILIKKNEIFSFFKKNNG